MALFWYKSYDPNGKIFRGYLCAADEAVLTDSLSHSHQHIIRMKRSPFYIKDRKKIHQELLQFWFQLGQFLSSGLRLHEIIGILRNSHFSLGVREILDRVYQDLVQGIHFSEALQKHPDFFDPICIQLIQVAQNTGCLKECCEKIYEYSKSQFDQQKQFYESVRYPLLLLGVFMGVIYILLTVLVPNIRGLYQDMNPKNTALSMQIVFWLSDHVRFVFTCLFLLMGSLGVIIKMRPAWIPFVRRIILLNYYINFFYGLKTLMNHGVMLHEALKKIQSLFQGSLFKQEMESIILLIEQGKTFSFALRQYGAFDETVLQIIESGEKNHALEKNFTVLIDYFKTEMDRKIKNISKMLEPILILVLGGVFIMVIVSIILPLYDQLQVHDV